MPASSQSPSGSLSRGDAPDEPSVHERYIRAAELKTVPSFTFRTLHGWNKDKPLLPFQERGVAWMFKTERCILADQVGLGKMVQAIALIQLLKELNFERPGKYPYKTLILCEKNTQLQWYKHIAEFTTLRATMISGDPEKRARQMTLNAEVFISTYPLLLRDFDKLSKIDFDMVICDEGSVFRHHDIKTSNLVKSITRPEHRRVVILDATPIQTSLEDFHGVSEALHMGIFGSKPAFERTYLVQVTTKMWRGRRHFFKRKTVAYQNVDDFKRRIDPYVLRRRADEVSANLPALTVDNVWLDLPKVQWDRYAEAKRGVISFIEQGRRKEARSHMHHAQMACDSTVHFGDAPDAATGVKVDWLVDKLQRDLSGEKVVVFVAYKKTIDHIGYALDEAGVAWRRFTADDSKRYRADALDDFWNDPTVQVLVGTTAFERGLNLQCSAFFIAFNRLPNPQRMTQLVGRVRRIGSPHAVATVINLFASGTMEEKMLKVLEQRAAVADYVFEESSDLFDALSDEQLLAILREGDA